MKQLSTIVVLVALIIASNAPTVVAANPSGVDLTGEWSWTSYLLDPTSVTSGAPLSTSTATIWATGILELKDDSSGGDNDPISGKLTFKPSGLIMDVTGRRVLARDGSEEVVFRGEGKRPTKDSGVFISMVYEIRGGVSTAWPANGSKLSLRGYIRNVEGDPFCPGGVGAFVLTPSQAVPNAVP